MTEQLPNPDHDPLNLAETSQIFWGALTHEAKALFQLHVSLSPDVHLENKIGDDFADFIGSGADWYPSGRALTTYFDTGLSRVGSMVATTTNNGHGKTRKFDSTEFGDRIVVPASGLMLDWSFRYPDHSVQTGFVGSKTGFEDKPNDTRLEILAELLTNPRPKIPLTEAGHGGHSNYSIAPDAYDALISRLQAASDALEVAGIISMESSRKANTAVFNLVETDGLPPQRGPKPGIVSQTIYEFVAEQRQLGNTSFEHETCLRYTLARIRELEPSIDEAEVRQQVARRLSATQPIKGIQRQTTYNNGGFTKLSVNEEASEAYSDLLNILIAIADEDPEMLQKGKEYAQAIFEDKDIIRTLIDKAYKFSPYAQAQPVEQSMSQVHKLVAQSSIPLDGPSIQKIYMERYGRRVSIQSINGFLSKLVVRGDLLLARDRPDPTSFGERNFYSANISDTA